MLPATVVICTHDRAPLLAEAVTHALAQVRTCDAELLVVDNASSDQTPRLLEELANAHAAIMRWVHEPRLGLSAARNRGLAEARGEIVVFLDDDAVPRPGWLAALIAPYASPEVAGTGGRITLRLPHEPPAWLTPPLATTLGAHDLGPATRPYPPGEYPQGGNMSFRLTAARTLGGFSSRIGLRGQRALGHEETDLCCRLVRAGQRLVYVADAVADHQVPPERLDPRWLLARQRANGESGAIFVLRNYGLRRALGWLRWHHRGHLTVRRYVPHEPVDPERLLAEFRRREAVGYVVGLARGIARLRTLHREASLPAQPIPAGRT